MADFKTVSFSLREFHDRGRSISAVIMAYGAEEISKARLDVIQLAEQLGMKCDITSGTLLSSGCEIGCEFFCEQTEFFSQLATLNL